MTKALHLVAYAGLALFAFSVLWTLIEEAWRAIQLRRRREEEWRRQFARGQTSRRLHEWPEGPEEGRKE